MSLIFATQLTAIATAVLAIFAIVTAIFAILAFRKQSREVRAIERQVKDQETLQRRAQATRILISAEPRPNPETSAGEPIRTNFVLVTNTSQQPIYDLKFLFRQADGEWTPLDDPPEPATVLMPGEQYQYPLEIDLPYVNFVVDPSLIAAGVVFCDASGVHWRLYSHGRLDEEPVTD